MKSTKLIKLFKACKDKKVTKYPNRKHIDDSMAFIEEIVKIFPNFPEGTKDVFSKNRPDINAG